MFIFIGISLGILLYQNWLKTILLSAIIPVCYLILRLYNQLAFHEKNEYVLFYY